MQLYCIVKPNSKTDSITVNPDGTLRIKIKASPVHGKANQYLIKFLSSVLNLSPKNISIISGFSGSHKRINIAAEEHIIIKKLELLTR